MRFRLPRPLKGWRVFAGEVGVVVLGVLLALGAQQVAAYLQMRSEVREFRRTIDHEIGLNLFVYDVRSRGSACNTRRIRDLLAWVQNAKDGAVMPRLRTYGPSIMVPYRSAWDSRDANVFAALPARDRHKYAEFYDELSGNSSRLQEEGELWVSIRGYDLGGPISIDDRRALYRQLVEALSIDHNWAGNMPVSEKIADELGVKPIRPDNISDDLFDDLDACEPIIVPAEAANSGGGAAGI